MAPRPGDGPNQFSTPLIIQADMPGLGLNATLSFCVKPSRKEQVAEGVIRLLHSLADEHEEDLQNFDLESTQATFEHLKRKAVDELESWRGQLKLVEEWKIKVDGTKSQMNKMREDYFKELQHLREQVYQKSKAEKEKKLFQPNYALHFDPTEYLDDEVAARVREKATLMEQEFSNRISEVEYRYRARVDCLTQQLMASRLKVTRMELLVEKTLKENGIEDAEEALGEVSVENEKVMESIENEVIEAEDRAVSKLTKEALDEQNESDDTSPQAADCKSSKSRRRSSNLGSINESGDVCFDADFDLGDDEGLSDGSGDSHDSLGSAVSHGSSMSKNSSASGKMSKLLGVANAVKKASRRFRGKGKTDKSKEESTKEAVEVVRIDAGVDALPYKVAFPKVAMHTRAVQSQIDSRMLEKAMDFFDKTAEDNWNLLAGITCDSDSSSEGTEDPDDFHEDLSDDILAASKNASSLRARMVTPTRFDLGRDGPKMDRSATMDLNQAMSELRVEEAEKLEVTDVKQSNERIHTIDAFGAIDWRRHFAGGGKRIFDTDVQEKFPFHNFHRELEVASQVKLTTTSQVEIQSLFTKGHLPNLNRRPSNFKPPVAKEDFGVQVAMISVVMISPFEQWFPADDDPHEIQLQQVLDMTNEILDRLPDLRQRAEKLAAEAKGDSNREQEVLSALRSLNLIPETSKPSVPSSPYASVGDDEARPARRQSTGLTLDGLLSRHGIVMASGRQSFPGAHDGGATPENVDGGRISLKSRFTKATTKSPLPLGPSNSPMCFGDCEEKPSTPVTPMTPTTPGQNAQRSFDNPAPITRIRRLPSVASQKAKLAQSDAATRDQEDRFSKLDPGWSGCGPQPEFMQLGVPAQRDYLEEEKKADPEKDFQVSPRRVSASSITFDGDGISDGRQSLNGRQSFPDPSRQSFNRSSFRSQVSFGRNSQKKTTQTGMSSRISGRSTFGSFRKDETRQSGNFEEEARISCRMSSQASVFESEVEGMSDDGFGDCLDMDDLLGELPGEKTKYIKPEKDIPPPQTRIGRLPTGSRRSSDPTDVTSTFSAGSVASTRRESDSSLELPGIATATPRSGDTPDNETPPSNTRLLGRLATTVTNAIHKTPSRPTSKAASKKKP